MSVTGLRDTSILIDASRQYALALHWLAGQTDLGVSSAVRLEMLVGAQNKSDQRDILRFLLRFDTIENTAEDFYWAESQLIRYQLSHQVGILDCLIAAASARLRLTLYTLNVRDFGVLLGALAVKPY
jgi:hypothetical protein